MGTVSRFFQWHEHPAAIAWWRANLGWALRWLTPRRRRAILATITVGLGIPNLLRMVATAPGFEISSGVVVSSFFVTIAVFLILWSCYVGAARFTSLPGGVRRHPQITLHLLFAGLQFFLWNINADAGAWRAVLVGFALILHLILWRLGYLLLSGQRGKVAGTRFTDHLIYLLPMQAGSFAYVPFGKGLDYLARHEAQDEEALARCQLAGIKLILLALLWKVMLSGLYAFVYGVPNAMNRALGGFGVAILPEFGALMAQGGNASLWQSWVSVYCETLRWALYMAMVGHVFVGTMRIFGFSIFRRTYKPLLAETLVQFWSRWDFYYKELLVDFFFLPTFAKWFRKWPAVRMFAAVFAAAFVGNMYCYLIARAVLWDYEAMWSHHSRLLYCLLLAVGIFVSMRREQQRAGRALPPGTARRCVRLMGVWTFFSLIRIWDHYEQVPFLMRTQFFLGLFGLA